MSPTPGRSPFSGQQFALSFGDYAAIVTEVGARLRALTYAGRPLVTPFGDDELPPLYRGAVLAPWPNRVGDGAYTFAGTPYQLPVNEIERMTALHGLVVWTPWRALDSDDERSGGEPTSRLRLGCRVWPQQGYPFVLDLELTYALGGDGLSIELAATNVGDRVAPYGCSIHPYLVAGEGRVDEWSLSLPAAEYLCVDAERLLPVEVISVAGSPMDFRSPTRIGARKVDHAFTNLAFDAAGDCVARLVGVDGRGVEMAWRAACPWVQVHTADRPEPAYDRVGLALEPMTCPPDAFRTGADLISLQPGQRTKANWRIRAI